MSFSWQNVAKSLGGSLEKNAEAQRRMQEQVNIMELQKKYADELIDPRMTRVEGNMEIYRNARGQELSRRELSPEEVADRKRVRDKEDADTRSAVAGAGLAEFNLGAAPEDKALDRENIRSAMADRAASRGIAGAQLGIARERLELDRENQDYTRGEALEEKVAVAEEILLTVGNTGNVSADAQLNALRVRLDNAISQNDTREVGRLVNEIKGRYGMDYLRAKTAATNTRGFQVPGAGGGAVQLRPPGE
jgi:hypothetical protein